MESHFKKVNSKSIRDQSKISWENQYHRGSPDCWPYGTLCTHVDTRTWEILQSMSEGKRSSSQRFKVRNLTAQGCFVNLQCPVADPGGTRDAPFLSVQFFSFSRSVWIKLCQVIGWRSPLCVWLPLLGNPELATGVKLVAPDSLNIDVIYLWRHRMTWRHNVVGSTFIKRCLSFLYAEVSCEKKSRFDLEKKKFLLSQFYNWKAFRSLLTFSGSHYKCLVFHLRNWNECSNLKLRVCKAVQLLCFHCNLLFPNGSFTRCDSFWMRLRFFTCDFVKLFTCCDCDSYVLYEWHIAIAQNGCVINSCLMSHATIHRSHIIWTVSLKVCSHGAIYSACDSGFIHVLLWNCSHSSMGLYTICTVAR